MAKYIRLLFSSSRRALTSLRTPGRLCRSWFFWDTIQVHPNCGSSGSVDLGLRLATCSVGHPAELEQKFPSLPNLLYPIRCGFEASNSWLWFGLTRSSAVAKQCIIRPSSHLVCCRTPTVVFEDLGPVFEDQILWIVADSIDSLLAIILGCYRVRSYKWRFRRQRGCSNRSETA